MHTLKSTPASPPPQAPLIAANTMVAEPAGQAILIGNVADLTEKPAVEEIQELRITPLGTFDHPAGRQRVDTASIQAMEQAFKREMGERRARGQRGTHGLPVYVNHPDDPRMRHILNDDSAYGWIIGLKASNDGLYGVIHWSEEGRKMLKERRFKYLSPRWAMRKDGGFVIPNRLVSVGLTNTPNIPGDAIANSRHSEPGSQGEAALARLGRAVLDMWGIPEDRLTTAANQAGPSPVEQVCANIRWQREKAEQADRMIEMAENTTRIYRGHLVAPNLATAELEIANACANGVLVGPMVHDWRERFQDAAADPDDFAKVRTQLQREPRRMKTAANAVSAEAGIQNARVHRGSRIATDRNELLRKFREDGMSQDAAWAAAKKDRPDLFENHAAR